MFGGAEACTSHSQINAGLPVGADCKGLNLDHHKAKSIYLIIITRRSALPTTEALVGSAERERSPLTALFPVCSGSTEAPIWPEAWSRCISNYSLNLAWHDSDLTSSIISTARCSAVERMVA